MSVERPYTYRARSSLVRQEEAGGKTVASSMTNSSLRYDMSKSPKLALSQLALVGAHGDPRAAALHSVHTQHVRKPLEAVRLKDTRSSIGLMWACQTNQAYFLAGGWMLCLSATMRAGIANGATAWAQLCSLSNGATK